MNAPRTIWVDPGLAEDLEEKSEFIEEVQYIRADVVDQMIDDLHLEYKEQMTLMEEE
jgi:hypothetical protein